MNVTQCFPQCTLGLTSHHLGPKRSLWSENYFGSRALLSHSILPKMVKRNGKAQRCQQHMA